jgi:hypothetical protein
MQGQNRYESERMAGAQPSQAQRDLWDADDASIDRQIQLERTERRRASEHWTD